MYVAAAASGPTVGSRPNTFDAPELENGGLRLHRDTVASSCLHHLGFVSIKADAVPTIRRYRSTELVVRSCLYFRFWAQT